MNYVIEKNKWIQAGKWVVAVVSTCVILGVCALHIDDIVRAIIDALSVFKPLIIGFALAIILNVPLGFVESKILRKKKEKRVLGILISLLLVFGVFIGIFAVVIPELIEALSLLVQIVTGSLDHLALEDTGFEVIAKEFSDFNIDWIAAKDKVEEWIGAQKDNFFKIISDTTTIALKELVSFFIGLVFAIYILAKKELLKGQFRRVSEAWMPERWNQISFHIVEVFGKTFKSFVSGQATEALILGGLCLIGMLFLRIPYAPMVSALIGVTALIPILGAYIGTFVSAIMIFTVSPMKALIFIIFIVVLQQVEGNVIYPRTVGAKINLPAIWVFAAVVVGGNIAGPIGMLIGVPTTSALFSLAKEATIWREQKKKERKLKDNGK